MAHFFKVLPIIVPFSVVVFSASELLSIWQAGLLWRGYNSAIAATPGVIAAIWLGFELWQMYARTDASR